MEQHRGFIILSSLRDGYLKDRDIIAVGQKVADFDNTDLNELYNYLYNKGHGLEFFEETVKVFVLHAAMDPRRRESTDGEGSPYRRITEREARNMALKKSESSG